LHSHARPYVTLGEVLETPAGDEVVVAMAAVGILVIEDGFDRLGGFAGESFGADVDGAVSVGGEELDALASKGRSTAAM
jgi:hypothetical protein